MTTDRDLRDLLSTEADGPTRSAAGWDDVLQRGRRHRRVVRARQGLAAGGVAVIVALVALTLGQLHTDDQQGVVTNQPDSTTRPAVDDAPTTPRPAGLAALPDLRSARASGVFVTLIINPSDPSAGVDPCTQESALVVETATDVTVRIQNHRELHEHQVWWAACQSSAFSGWATVELTDPLGTRRLIDAGDGLEIPVIDNADLLFPTWIPAPFGAPRDPCARAPAGRRSRSCGTRRAGVARSTSDPSATTPTRSPVPISWPSPTASSHWVDPEVIGATRASPRR